MRQLLMELEERLRNTRGVPTTLPATIDPPTHAYHFEVITFHEIDKTDPLQNVNRTQAGIRVPDGHYAVLSHFALHQEHWLDETSSRLHQLRLYLNNTEVDFIWQQGFQFSAIASWNELRSNYLIMDTSFRDVANRYVFIYNGWGFYRRPNDPNEWGSLHRHGWNHTGWPWQEIYLLLGPGDLLEWRSLASEAPGDTYPRVVQVGQRGFIFPIREQSDSREGLLVD